jgi:hypothetical protein
MVQFKDTENRPHWTPQHCFADSISELTLTVYHATILPLKVTRRKVTVNKSATRRSNELILEGIVTTKNEDGSTNVSPMGPVVDREVKWLRLRPFASSMTYQNLRRTGRGIFHVTDDVELLARAVIGELTEPPSLHACESFDGMVVSNACRWYAFEVMSIDDSNDRVEIECRVVQRGKIRDFLGWNRAMHAVLEAAILASRVQFLGAEDIESQLVPLAIIVDKTASDRERNAFRMICDFISRLR